MRAEGLEFQNFVGAIRGEKRADFSICDLRVSVKVETPGQP